MTIRTDLADNFSNLGFETHVEHTIGFVHDEVSHSTKVSFAGLEHIDKTTGSSNNNFNTTLKVTDLRALGSTTVDGCVSDARVGAELCAFLLNLDGKFTSRGKDKGNGAVAGSEERLAVRELEME